ncbi:MAG: BREX-1 system adenine-specific DNA-methyltransferase PglX [Aeromonas veronii]
MSQQDNKEMAKYFYRASAADFKKIPGSPVAYWISNDFRSVFNTNDVMGVGVNASVGLFTCDNNKFLRLWHEVSFKSIGLGMKCRDGAKKSNKKWFPYNKGGNFRRWYGNHDYVVNFYNDGIEIREHRKNVGQSWSLPGETYYFGFLVSWSDISSSKNSFRLFENGFIYDVKGQSACPDDKERALNLLASCNNKIVDYLMPIINPTMSFQVGNFKQLPNLTQRVSNSHVVSEVLGLSKNDWDSFEASWFFLRSPIIISEVHTDLLSLSYQKLSSYRLASTLKMQRLEEENNRLFIEAYGLQDELTPEVPLSEITLTSNPHYRYGGNLSDEERDARLQSDTICELISYAIGCMMGRYSLDREGLVYAHAGNVGFNDLVAEGAYQTFAADGDGILPLTSEHWFEDDIAARIEEFLRTVWGADTLEENLQFIADSLCLSAIKPPKKGGETSRETIRRYLSTQFFKDHLKTYKKRPIYWLFSSGKEKAFECLVYLHRYNEATLPRMRTEYVTPLLGQMASRIERLRLQQTEASTSDAKRIGKEIDSLTKQLAELRAFDDQLKHHADMRITLDLDDGVKVNYGKFGTLLSDVKAITGDKGE